MSTGFPQEDAKSDFARERRRRALARIAARLRHEPDDVSTMLPFEEVVAALGRRSRARPRRADDPARLDRRHGRPARGEFDRDVPARVAAAARTLGADRRGAPARRADAADRRLPDRRAALRPGRPPPRVGRARAGRHDDRGARRRGRDRARRRPRAAAPRPAAQAARARCSASACRCRPRRARASSSRTSGATRSSRRSSRPGASAPATRASTCSPREDMARAWFTRGVRAGRRGAGRGRASAASGTETERYLRVAMLRFLLLHTHDWADDVVERLLGEARAPGAEDDTMVHQILKEMR